MVSRDGGLAHVRELFFAYVSFSSVVINSEIILTDVVGPETLIQNANPSAAHFACYHAYLYYYAYVYDQVSFAELRSLRRRPGRHSATSPAHSYLDKPYLAFLHRLDMMVKISQRYGFICHQLANLTS